MRRGARRPRRALPAAAMLAAAVGPPAAAQQIDFSEATNIVVPQQRAFALASPGPDRPQGVRIESVSASVVIRDAMATTTLEIGLRNHSPRLEESVLLLPVPAGAAVGAFDFQGGGAEPSAEILPAGEARRIYESIVAKTKDPALLEFAGLGVLRSSVFPVEPHADQRIRLTYDHILETDGGRVDYLLPRSESLELRRPWTIEARVISQRPISTVYSPSHRIESERVSAGEFRTTLAAGAASDPGPFRLSYLVDSGEGVSGTLFAYPDPSVGADAGGYFLLMLGLPSDLRDGRAPPKREVTLVIDRSGSMAGAKMDQVKAAAVQIVDGLQPGEAFNIITYASQVSRFAAAPVVKNERTRAEALDYINAVNPRGGTNIHDALLEAITQQPRDGFIPIVLFLTDGLPTVGKTSEVDIREMVEAANLHDRRLFTFGVGDDVNAPLLERLADVTRAKPSFVLPGEDVELAIARVFRQLQGPVLAGPALTVLDDAGAVSTRRIEDLIPQAPPDLFDGDQLVVLGKHRRGGPVTFELTGEYLGAPSTFTFTFDLSRADTANAFVPRLWAVRRIAFLIDQIRQAGAAQGANLGVPAGSIVAAPEHRELIDEIVRLSREWGILTEYTSFLVREGTDLSDEAALRRGCQAELDAYAVRKRVGREGVAQSLNSVHRKSQESLNISNRLWDARGRVVEFTGVQQINDRALFKRDGVWIDSRLLASGGPDLADARACVIGSEAHRALLRRLAGENRAGLLSIPGELLLSIDGEAVRITPPSE